MDLIPSFCMWMFSFSAPFGEDTLYIFFSHVLYPNCSFSFLPFSRSLYPYSPISQIQAAQGNQLNTAEQVTITLGTCPHINTEQGKPV